MQKFVGGTGNGTRDNLLHAKEYNTKPRGLDAMAISRV